MMTDGIKGQDQFGYNSGFNYDGSATIQTIPGGILSLFMVFCFVCYSFAGAHEMVNYK